jgi:Holliday junction resolvase RusA-like endonuclease
MTAACVRCGYDPDAQIAARWEFFVPHTVKSGNHKPHNVGAARHQYRKEREGWERTMAFLKYEHKVTQATSKRRVTLTRIIGHRQRAFDTDNLATGLKPCVDAMVRVGMLVNDDAAHAEIHRSQEKRGRSFGGLVVLIEELAA